MMRFEKTLRYTASVAVLSLIAGAAPASAICTNQGLDLMKSLNGAWKGRGAVTPIGGAAERVSCRVTYAMFGEAVLNQVVTCAGTDYKIEASSRVTCEGNLLDGTFEEKIGNNTGHVSGTISGSHLDIDADGPSFKGRFNVQFKGDANHLVSITQFDPAKGRQVPVASIQLTR